MGHILVAFQRKVHFCLLVCLFVQYLQTFANVVFVMAGCYIKIPQTGGCKQQKSISRSSRGWEVYGQGASRLVAQ